MMKILHTLMVVLMLIDTTYSQSWKPVEYLDKLSFKLPDNFSIQDTTNCKIFAGSDSNGDYQMIVFTSSIPNFHSVEELNNFYSEYLSGMSKKMKEFKLVENSNTTFKGLQALRSTFHSREFMPKLIIENLSFYMQGSMFNFSLYRTENQKARFEDFTSGINFKSSMTIQDQITKRKISLLNSEKIGEILGFIVLGGIVLLVLKFRNKKNKITKK